MGCLTYFFCEMRKHVHVTCYILVGLDIMKASFVPKVLLSC